jgi:hypothetical protein
MNRKPKRRGFIQVGKTESTVSAVKRLTVGWHMQAHSVTVRIKLSSKHSGMVGRNHV